MRCKAFIIVFILLLPIVHSIALPPPPAVGTKSTACEDLVLTDGETDIDCGGRCSFIGQKCAEGQNCKASTDCTTNVCSSGVCVAGTAKASAASAPSTSSASGASGGSTGGGSGGGGRGGGGYVAPKKPVKKAIDTCQDSVLSGSESDIDCGGTCSPCTVGSQCSDNKDCATKYCYEDVCSVYEEIIGESTLGEDTFAKLSTREQQAMVGSATEVFAKQESNSLLIAGLSILVGILLCIAGYFVFHHFKSQPHPKLKQYIMQNLANGVDEKMLYNYLKEKGYEAKTLLKAFEK